MRKVLLAALAALMVVCAIPAVAQTLTTTTVTIANGESLSGAASIRPGSLVGIVTPSGWDTAAISLQVSVDGGSTYTVLWDDQTDGEWSVAAVPASRHLAISPSTQISYTSVKVQSGTSAAAVNQVGAVVLTLVLRRF